MKTNYQNGWCVQFQKETTDLSTDEDLFCDLMHDVKGYVPSGRSNFYGISYDKLDNEIFHYNDVAWGTCLTLKEGIVELQWMLKKDSDVVNITTNERIARKFVEDYFSDFLDASKNVGIEVLTKWLNEEDLGRIQQLQLEENEKALKRDSFLDDIF